MLKPSQPLAIYMEGAVGEPFGKMGHGVLRYSPNPIACVVDSRNSGGDIEKLTGIPRPCPIVSTVKEAKSLGAHALVLGIAPPGGQIPPEWMPVLDEAISHGLSLINGLHERLATRYPALSPGQFVWDVRVEPPGLSVGSGAAAGLRNKRVLMIGTDMAIGKMTSGLEIVKAARARRVRAEFVATGQIGIVIWGSGVALDAVRLDFASGAIEREVMRYADAELVVIEGQGALIHPASSATLPLMRGSCPTHMVLCHRACQGTLQRMPEIAIPPLADYIRLYEDVASACSVFPRAKVAAVALNTAHIAKEAEAAAACEALAAELDIPCTDPVRFGAQDLLNAI